MAWWAAKEKRKPTEGGDATPKKRERAVGKDKITEAVRGANMA